MYFARLYCVTNGKYNRVSEGEGGERAYLIAIALISLVG